MLVRACTLYVHACIPCMCVAWVSSGDVHITNIPFALQIHEMLAIELGGDEQIDDELDAYNPLLPQGRDLGMCANRPDMIHIEIPSYNLLLITPR